MLVKLWFFMLGVTATLTFLSAVTDSISKSKDRAAGLVFMWIGLIALGAIISFT